MGIALDVPDNITRNLIAITWLYRVLRGDSLCVSRCCVSSRFRPSLEIGSSLNSNNKTTHKQVAIHYAAAIRQSISVGGRIKCGRRALFPQSGRNLIVAVHKAALFCFNWWINRWYLSTNRFLVWSKVAETIRGNHRH